jgi:hypothetical protein
VPTHDVAANEAVFGFGWDGITLPDAFR